MGDKDKSKITSSEMENLSLDTSRCSRDFLTRFMGSGWRNTEFEAIKEEGCDDGDEEEEIELNLGLSLGGRLGVDKGSNKLMRSSSIAECLPIVKDEDDVLTSPQPPVAYSRLVRTTSLPLGSEEELRKRKELQTLRRMEAKRRRSEKQRNLKLERDEGSSGGAQLQEEKRETHDLNLRGRFGKDRLLAAAKRMNTLVAPPFGSPFSAADGKGKGVQESGQKLSRGSVESQGGSSSELDNRSLQRSGSCGDASQSLQECSNQDVASSSTKIRGNTGRTSSSDVKNPSKQSDMTRNQAGETRTNAMEDMPCVFTKGDGPNGRRVDGILYKYGRGEEVRIMCVCHGSFHSPAEFVKHAGGTDITHPLKHIVVNPNSTPLT